MGCSKHGGPRKVPLGLGAMVNPVRRGLTMHQVKKFTGKPGTALTLRARKAARYVYGR